MTAYSLKAANASEDVNITMLHFYLCLRFCLTRRTVLGLEGDQRRQLIESRTICLNTHGSGATKNGQCWRRVSLCYILLFILFLSVIQFLLDETLYETLLYSTGRK
ncbi:unnamed protein product [Acanthoscelides obtectus]|uniref:Uncharacterized protein n=1 Tax=Acanthoscelides obtectus TaxID=200917 RepID=A0A9P0Q0E4_ACAOB|nr:unnamed protein product [Acanthoscelides obtectus]CAK1649673.1 hypothetical protein AOBTE_LOCUS16353 [Acanthoscelides obtectus]